MPAATRQGDIGSGHGCHFPETSATGGSATVFVNGKPLMRVGDSYEAHACSAGDAGPHDRALGEGSASVFIEGRPAGRVGDAISCGGAAQTGSEDVFIGDEGIGGADGEGTGGGTACQMRQAERASPATRG